MVFARSLGLKRQRRVTNYTLLLAGVTGFAYLKSLALSAGAVAKSSGLWPSVTPLAALAPQTYKGVYLLNGRRLTNPFLQLYVGDILMAHAVYVRRAAM